MTDLKKNKKQRRIQRTKDLIITAAFTLFSEKPYSEISVEEIADYAALSKATLYNYFQNKETIYFSVGIRGLEDGIKRRKNIPSSTHSGLEDVIAFFRYLFDAMNKNSLSLKILRQFHIKINQVEQSAEEILKKLKKVENNPELLEEIDVADQIFARYIEKLVEYEELYRSAINKGIKDGSIQTDLTVEQLYQFLNLFVTGMLNQIELQKIPLRQVNLTKDKLLDTIIKSIEILLKSL